MARFNFLQNYKDLTGYTAQKKKITKRIEPSIKAGEYIVNLANKGQLDSVLIKSASLDAPNIKFPEELSGVVFARIMDINNDGVMERVFVESQGTAHIESFIIYKLKTNEVIEPKELLDGDRSDDAEHWSDDYAFFEYQGTTYILGKTDQSLSHLIYINPKNEMKIICEFKQREKPLQRLKTCHDEKICRLAQEDHLSYVQYDKLHSLTYITLQNAGVYETHPSDKAALFDIDNDGKNEMVVKLNLSSGSGRGCESSSLAVLTPDRTSMDISYENKLPASRCGGTEIKPFIIDGKTYLDERQDGPYADHRQIYMLKKNELKTICEFEVRPINYVLNAAESVETNAGDEANLWEYIASRPGTTAVDALIKEGKHLNKALQAQKSGLYPIEAALFHKRDDILEKLLKAGADPNATRDEHKMFPWNLTMAVKDGSQKSVRLLLKYGAKDLKRYPLSAREAAVENNDIEKFEMLLKGGIPVDGDFALAVIEGHNKNKYTILKLMMKYGLTPNIICTKSYPTEGIVQEAPGVISIGPEVKFKNVDKTIFEWAKITGDTEVLRILSSSKTGKVNSETYLALRKANLDLNEVYREFLRSLDQNSKQTLKEEQRTWIKERDKKCGLQVSGKGTQESWLMDITAHEQQAKCVYEETTKRTAELAARFMPCILMPGELVEDRSTVEWIQAYWNWSKSFPEGQEPFKDKNGSLGGQKQSGSVWFLVGSDTGSHVIRSCEVPAGKYILIPVVMSLAEDESNSGKQCARMKNILESLSNGVQDIPGTEESRKQLPNFSISLITLTEGKLTLQKDPVNYTDIYVEIDKKKVPYFFLRYQATDCFTLNKWNKTSQAVCDGYWLILKPFTPGKHTINFGGKTIQDSFSQDVQYNLNIK